MHEGHGVHTCLLDKQQFVSSRLVRGWRLLRRRGRALASARRGGRRPAQRTSDFAATDLNSKATWFGI
jgi:hypothetical protein